jgi:metal-responsive CopG/Arc/MetJ family transcriptional regulator
MATSTRINFSVSLLPELVERLDAIAQERHESRSAVIERIIRNGVPDEEQFLQSIENPVKLTIMDLLQRNPKVIKALATVLGEYIDDDMIERTGKQVALAKQRRGKKGGATA